MSSRTLALVVAAPLVALGAWWLVRSASAAEQTSALGVHDSQRLVEDLKLPMEEWEFLYQLADVEQIQAEIEAWRHYMYEETHAYYEGQFAAGHYELVPADRPDGGHTLDLKSGLAAWRKLPDGKLATVKLPREGFEHVYEAGARMSWLMALEDERKAYEEADAK